MTENVDTEKVENTREGDSENIRKLAEVTRLKDEAEKKNKILSKEKEVNETAMIRLQL